MSWKSLVILATGVVWSLMFRVMAIEVPLTIKRDPTEANGQGFSCPQSVFEIAKSPPHGEWKIPALVSPDPQYAILTFDNRPYLMVLDRQKKEDLFFTRAYLDANGDRDLTNDPPVDDSTHGEHSGHQARFRDMEVQVGAAGNCHPYWFSVLVWRYSPGLLGRLLQWTGLSTPPELYAHAEPACYYEGEFTLNDSQYHIKLKDANTNGTFSDTHQDFKGAESPLEYRLTRPDLLLLAKKGEKPVILPISDLVLLEDSLFTMKVESAATKLELTPVSEDTVPVTFGSPPDTALLKDEKRKVTLLLCRPTGNVPIPVGEYRLVQYEISRKAKDGRLWRIEGGGGGETPPLILDSGMRSASWPYGEPFNATAIPSPYQGSKGWFGNTVNLRFELQGKGKDRVSTPPEFLVDEAGAFRAPPTQPPGFKVLKADGEVVAQGVFRYG